MLAGLAGIECRFLLPAGSPKPADHPVYAITIVTAITVVKAKASAIAAKIFLIA